MKVLQDEKLHIERCKKWAKCMFNFNLIALVAIKRTLNLIFIKLYRNITSRLLTLVILN